MKQFIFLLIIIGSLTIGYLAAWNDGQYSQAKFTYLTERDRLAAELDQTRLTLAAERQERTLQAISQLTPGLIVFSMAVIILAAAAVAIQWLKTKQVQTPTQTKTVIIYKAAEPTRQVRTLTTGMEPIEVIIPERQVVNVQK